jgi:hypothetical protein
MELPIEIQNKIHCYLTTAHQQVLRQVCGLWRDTYPALDKDVFALLAYKEGAVDLIQSHHLVPTRERWEAAARGGSITLFQHLATSLDQNTVFSIAPSAAAEGHLELLQWFRQQGYLLGWETGNVTVVWRRLEVAKWLVRSRQMTPSAVLARAVEVGYSELVRWLLETNYRGRRLLGAGWDRSTTIGGLGKEEEEITELLRGHGFLD